MKDNEATVVVLKNGLRVANFSSPHSFTFTDGSVLEACSAKRAKKLMLEHVEVEHKMQRWTDIELKFEMSEPVMLEVLALIQRSDIDIVLVPLPVLELVREKGWTTKIRGIRVADRVTKTIHCDRFCL